MATEGRNAEPTGAFVSDKKGQGGDRDDRGMVVTTSDFTSGAVGEAKNHDVHLINGCEFLALVRGAVEDSDRN